VAYLKILVHDYAGHPFQIQLSRELARRGYRVLHLYYGYNNTPKGNLKRCATDSEHLSIEGVFTQDRIRKYSYVRRWFQDLEYGNLVAQRMDEFKPDVVLSANTPLDAQRIILSKSRKIGSRFIFWLQDLSGVAAHHLLRNKIPVVGEWIGLLHLHLEQRMLRDSDRVVLIADDFKPIILKWGVKQGSISIIPNWAPLNEMPVRDKYNSWAIKHGVESKFCFLYTGGLGSKHNPDLLFRLALRFKKNDDGCIMIISEGPWVSWLESKKEEFELDNLIILDYQPFEQMPNVLASGDVLVAILEPDAGSFSVPSKVLTYLCARRPVLLAVPSENLAAQIVLRKKAGIVVPPDDMDAFMDAAERLFKDPELRARCGENARSYAEENFDIQKIADSFEAILL
jgi:colanic acid biosynthesis glycosyl transferase WcaI